MKRKAILTVALLLAVSSVLFAQTRTVPTTTTPGQQVPDNFVQINGGQFIMGSTAREPNRNANEVEHRAGVKAFYMGKYQVTQKEYEEIMGINPSSLKGVNVPVENVTWFDAVEYCNKRSEKEGLSPAYTISGRTPATGYPITNATVTWNQDANGYRLPTETEWEYACRAETRTPYNTGPTINTSQATYLANRPTNVGSFPANPWGLFDMHGNVHEWCWDWFGAYSTAPQTDPMGPSSGTDRVVRGGAWNSGTSLLRTASRGSEAPATRNNAIGFRLVRLVPPAPVEPRSTWTPPPDPPLGPGKVQNTLIQIKGGTFTIGSPANEPERTSNESPRGSQPQVTLHPFFMAKYPVTQKEYVEIMGINPSRFKGPDLPVDTVTWFDAVEYCNKLSQKEGLSPAYTITNISRNQVSGFITDATVSWNRDANGYRLPTEAEWEYACRAGTTTPFSTGNNITTNQANYNGNNPYNNNAKGTYREMTTDVGTFPANPWGFHDMHGNVWEWCWDRSGGYNSGHLVNPIGHADYVLRVLRGGSWIDGGKDLRSAYRRENYPGGDMRNTTFGFRVVRRDPDTFERVRINGGTFTMGSPANEPGRG
ncbi:MAG: formylglycine-generating enzyme family protein, partial [Treponema sp.]|nr:formylglycine-generating enzyme family protein [Treponema sp.]